MVKKILIAILLLALIGAGAVYYVWNKPHRDVNKEKGIVVSADSLSKLYNGNEKAADSAFLNKAIEVSGTVVKIDSNSDGGIMVILETHDPLAEVQCAMRDKGTVVAAGQKVVVKGFCSGLIFTNVSLTDCVIK